MTHTVLITGASSGIGQACAERFAKEGWRLILTGRRQQRLEAIQQALVDEFACEVHSLAFDVQDRDHTIESLASLPEAWKTIDVLVNNAGLAAGLDSFEQACLDDFEQMINTNIKGLLFVTHTILPWMLAKGRGDIINIGSISGHQVYPKGHVYCGTKHAVHAITQGLRHDTAGQGIRVCSVDPGAVATEFSLVRFKQNHDKAKSVYEGFTPLHAEDIADAVYYCASRPLHVCIADMIVLPSQQSAVDKIAKTSS